MVGDNQPQSGNNENENQRCQIDGEQATRWDDAVYKPGKANAQGISLDNVNAKRLTGVTLICSIVPISFSPTTFKAGRKPQSITSTIVMSAGTM